MPNEQSDMMSPDDLGRIQEIEREFAVVVNTAPPVLAQFYRECIAGGMPPVFSFHLVRMWFTAMLAYDEIQVEGDGEDEETNANP